MDEMAVVVSRAELEAPSDDDLGVWGVDRRSFLQVLGSGLLISVTAPEAWAQPGGSAGMPVSARLLLGKDGTITALSGKVEEGQGPRAELSQAAAEELRVAVDRVRLVMADTDLVPDDGITAAKVPRRSFRSSTGTAFRGTHWQTTPPGFIFSRQSS